MHVATENTSCKHSLGADRCVHAHQQHHHQEVRYAGSSSLRLPVLFSVVRDPRGENQTSAFRLPHVESAGQSSGQDRLLRSKDDKCGSTHVEVAVFYDAFGFTGPHCPTNVN